MVATDPRLEGVTILRSVPLLSYGTSKCGLCRATFIPGEGSELLEVELSAGPVTLGYIKLHREFCPCQEWIGFDLKKPKPRRCELPLDHDGEHVHGKQRWST